MPEDIIVLYENEDVVVINKPAGLVVHPDGKTTEPSVVDWVLSKYPHIQGVGEPLITQGYTIDRPGIVHRLDRETSGVLLIAKNEKSFLFYKEQFQARSLSKTYRAFVYGYITDNEGVIDAPIGRSPNDFRRFLSGRGARGVMRDAVTGYTVFMRFELPKEKGDKRKEDARKFTYVELSPQTGRTHQLRVHLQYLQHPIVSDTLYAPKKEQALGFKRVALHAFSLTFPMLSGEEVKVEAPLPPDFLMAEEIGKKSLA